MFSIYFLLALFYAFSSVWAQTPQIDRRIEQEKRENLAFTQSYIPAETRAPFEPDIVDTTEYFRELLSKPVTYQADICRAIVILLGLEGQYHDTDSQSKALAKMGIITEKIKAGFNPDSVLTKGITAYMFCKAIKLKGGILSRALGLTPRWAIKELVFRDIMSYGNVDDAISGRELIVILTNAANYLAMTKQSIGVQGSLRE